MKFFMEKNKNTGDRVTINIPKKTINNSIIEDMTNIGKKINLNGFRKGKVPIRIVQEKYGSDVYHDVFKKLMKKFFYEFIQEKKIKIIGSPKYYIHQNNEKKQDYFQYSVLYEKYPIFSVESISNIKAKKIIVELTNQEIKKYIEKREKKYIWKQVNTAIKQHDRVTIQYSIYTKNKKIKNTKHVSFIVSKNTFIPQLNYKIINHFINDIIFFKIRFHSLHPIKDFQNQDITFKIKITNIERKEEILKNDKQDKSTDPSYENIKQYLNAQIIQITEKYLEDQIFTEIVKKNIVKIPPNLFQEEIKTIYKKYKKEYYVKGKHNILEKKYYINFDLEAKKKIYTQIILEKIISEKKLYINEKDIEFLIKKMSLNYKRPIEIINLYRKNEYLKHIIKNIELKKRAMSFLKKSIKIVEEHWSLENFINYNSEIHEELTI